VNPSSELSPGDDLSLTGKFYLPHTNRHSTCLVDDVNHNLAGNQRLKTKPLIVKIQQEPFWHEPGGHDRDGEIISLEMVFVCDRQEQVHLVPFAVGNVFGTWERALTERDRRYAELLKSYDELSEEKYTAQINLVRQSLEKHEKQLSRLKMECRGDESMRTQLKDYSIMVHTLRTEYQELLTEFGEWQRETGALPELGTTPAKRPLLDQPKVITPPAPILDGSKPGIDPAKFDPRRFNW